MNIERQCRDLRDELARERTELASERTFLAYVRTSLMFLASGVTLLKLFGDDDILRTLGYLLVPVSLVVGITGYIRFRRIRKQLKVISLKD